MERLVATLSKTGKISYLLTTNMTIEGRDRLLRLFQYLTRYLKWHLRELMIDKENSQRYHGISGRPFIPESYSSTYRVPEINQKVSPPTGFRLDLPRVLLTAPVEKCGIH